MTTSSHSTLKAALTAGVLSLGLAAGALLGAAQPASADFARPPRLPSQPAPLPDFKVVALDRIPGQAVLGEPFSYRLAVRNDSFALGVSTSLDLEITTPAGTSVSRVTHSPRMLCTRPLATAGPQLVSCNVSAVGVNDEVPFTIEFGPSTAPGTVTVKTTVDPNNGSAEADEENNKRELSTTIVRPADSSDPVPFVPAPQPTPPAPVVGIAVLGPDLGVTLRDDVGMQGVSRDGGFQYHTEVQNQGTQRLSHIILSVHFFGAELDPARGDRVVDVFGVGGFQTRLGSDGVYLVEGALDPGQKANVAVFVHAPDQAGTIRAEATVVATTDGGQVVQETNSANNRASVTTTVR